MDCRSVRGPLNGSSAAPKWRWSSDSIRRSLEALRSQRIGGVLLLLMALAALVWANTSPASYAFVFTEAWHWSAAGPALVFRDVINDGLMSLFFFVVAMEIKRELTVGELGSVPRAMLPAIAALGGMVVPAALFLAFTAGGPAAAGWGVPIATDIAFCVGVLSLLNQRIPRALIVFIAALAVFDDVGGILVIACFYGHGIDFGYLALATLVLLVGICAGRARTEHTWVYVLLGTALWWAIHEAGIHPTIAGVALGLIVPTVMRRRTAAVSDDSTRSAVTVAAAPLSARYLHALHAPVTLVVLPLFALANSGVSLAGMGLATATTPVTLGIFVALVIGKPIGILVPTLLAVRFGIAPMPGAATRSQLLGASICAGIGFTVSLFIGALAYHDAPALLAQAKLGVLAASAVAGVAGYCMLRWCARPHGSP